MCNILMINTLTIDIWKLPALGTTPALPLPADTARPAAPRTARGAGENPQRAMRPGRTATGSDQRAKAAGSSVVEQRTNSAGRRFESCPGMGTGRFLPAPRAVAATGSSVVEHQANNLTVAGSTPAPRHGRKPVSPRKRHRKTPEGDGVRVSASQPGGSCGVRSRRAGRKPRQGGRGERR